MHYHAKTMTAIPRVNNKLPLPKYEFWLMIAGKKYASALLTIDKSEKLNANGGTVKQPWIWVRGIVAGGK